MTTPEPAGRDGFVIWGRSTGAEDTFIPCDKDGMMRERVREGLLMRVDFDRFYFTDTREGSGVG